MPAEPAAGPNTAGLAAAARTRHELARAKAVKALRDLQRQGAPVTFVAVAATAGVSRSWLYRQADLRQQINQALERNRQLADDNARMRRQLAQALGEQRQPPPQVARQRSSRHASTTIGP
jgi:hypothetical protein